jgi:dienelactone hydrolase
MRLTPLAYIKFILIAGLGAATTSWVVAAEANPVRADFLRLIDRPRVPAAPELHQARAQDGLERWDFTYASDASNRVPGILVKPTNSSGRRPVVIALHGTGGNKEGALGFASQMAKAGFIGVVIDGRYHGERAPSGKSSEDYPAAILRAYHGNGEHPLYFDTVWDVMRLIDYLGTRDDVDPARIGLFGISKGGIETYLAAAVDPRVAVAVPCLAVQGFEWELEHNAWQSRAGTFAKAFSGAAKDAGVLRPDAAFLKAFYARVAPGIDAEFDGPSIVPLIAPRPLLAINGDSDARTPRPGLDEIAEKIQSAYAARGAANCFTLLLERHTAHKVTSEGIAAAQAWFIRWLKP